MTFAAETIAIENKLSTTWTTTPIAYENVDYEPTPGTPYIEIFVKTGESMHASLGPKPIHRFSGVILINIYVEKSVGLAQAMTYADTLAAIYRDQQFSGITCRSPYIKKAGQVGEWQVLSLIVPFLRDEIF
jgi:hypothetical protein